VIFLSLKYEIKKFVANISTFADTHKFFHKKKHFYDKKELFDEYFFNTSSAQSSIFKVAIKREQTKLA